MPRVDPAPLAPRAGALPVLPGLSHDLAMLRDPYRFIARACAAAGSDVVQARLLLQPTLLLTGADAAALFYDPQRFVRSGAAPEPLRATLFGRGTVQSLDGEPHRVRKHAFLAQLGGAALDRLDALAAPAWHEAIDAWAAAGRIVLYREVQFVLARVACAWAGVPLPEADVPRRTAQLVALFDGAASGLRNHLTSRRARHDAERWLAGLVAEARAGAPAWTHDGPAAAVARWGDGNGLLPERVAAAELLNLLRPIVATSVYVVFAADALHRHPAARARLQQPAARDGFVEEVRRHYPFFPAVAARVREDFEWRGIHFPKGRRALLDLYGTNHDPRLWIAADRFLPGRFVDVAPSRFAFIPQGGGDPATGHRCPGEAVVRRLVGGALRAFAARLEWTRDDDAPGADFGRLPAVPRDGYAIRVARRA